MSVSNVHVYTCVDENVYAHAHAQIYIHVYTHIYTHLYTHVYTHTPPTTVLQCDKHV